MSLLEIIHLVFLIKKFEKSMHKMWVTQRTCVGVHFLAWNRYIFVTKCNFFCGHSNFRKNFLSGRKSPFLDLERIFCCYWRNFLRFDTWNFGSCTLWCKILQLFRSWICLKCFWNVTSSSLQSRNSVSTFLKMCCGSFWLSFLYLKLEEIAECSFNSILDLSYSKLIYCAFLE